MDKKGKTQILKTIQDAWVRNPELRFGQLIINAVPESSIYYASDRTVLESICKTYKVPVAAEEESVLEELEREKRGEIEHGD